MAAEVVVTGSRAALNHADDFLRTSGISSPAMRQRNLDARVATINYAATIERAGLTPRFEYGVDVGGAKRYIDLVGLNRRSGQAVEFVQFVKNSPSGTVIRADELVAARQIEAALKLPNGTVRLVNTGR